MCTGCGATVTHEDCVVSAGGYAFGSVVIVR